MTKIAAVIQCVASDLCASTDADDYVVGPLLGSDLFDSVTIAAPNIGDVSRLRKQASVWGVNILIGYDYDICSRMLAVSEQTGATILARFILRRFYVDLNLVGRMIDLVENGNDYVSVGTEVNYEVGADVCSRSALQRCQGLLASMKPGYDTANYRFYPWRLMEDHPQFMKTRIEAIDPWPRDKSLAVRKKLGALLSGQGENQSAVDLHAPAGRYRFLLDWINPGSTVVDIACGKGGGCHVLAEKAGNVVGIDYDAGYIAAAREANENPRIRFLLGDETALVANGDKWADYLVSLHTLEHVDNADSFLKFCHAALKPGGSLLLEVPRLLPLPLGMPLFPFHKIEYRPETLEPLLREAGFKIVDRRGGNRGTYGHIDNARDTLFYHARRQ